MPGSENTNAANPSAMPSTDELDDFTKKVNEVSILVDGLKKGTISPAYVDSKLAQVKPQLPCSQDKAGLVGESDDFAFRRASVQRKVEEIKSNLEKKRRARKRYEQHIQCNPPTVASTDYVKWDIWCPEDDEDELVASCKPDNAQLRAMEKDINDRHARMVRDRQRAERCRKAGIEAYTNKQWSKAYMLFDEGCNVERSNAKLHSNAAMAAIQMGCYAQAIEHCEKVIRIHEFLLEKPEHPMVVKAWQRMAAARVGLKHFKEAAEAMEAALLLAPDDFEIIQGAQRAQRAYNEQKIVRDLTVSKASMKELHEIESLTCAFAAIDMDSIIAACPSKAALGVAALPASTASQQAAGSEAVRVRRMCDDLISLLHGHNEWRVYFRSCGGLQSVACLLSQCLCLWQGSGSHGKGSGAPAAYSNFHSVIAGCAQLLNEACQVDTNGHALTGCLMGEPAGQTQRISSNLECEKFLFQCCIASASFDAIAVLLHTLSTDELSRHKIAESFLVKDAASRQTAVDSAFEQLLRLEKVHQSVTVSLLSNCMTVGVFAKNVSEALGTGNHADVFQALLQNQTNPIMCELAANLLANSATFPKMRNILACESVIQPLVGHCSRFSSSEGSLSEIQALKSCLTCLYNLGLARDATAVSECLNADSWILTVKSLLNHEDTAVTQLAICVEVRHAAAAHSDLMKIEGLAHELISVAIEAGVAAAVMPNMQTCRTGLRTWQDPVALKTIDAVIRILAGIGAAGHTHVLKTSVAVELLAWACCTQAIMDGCAGNAALCIGFIADDKSLVPVLQDRGVVTGLVDMAYRRHGTPASRNAAITAAKLAQDPTCLQQMRACHGFEKIHSYVKL